ncbi:hypothetical protein CRUP_028345, partial [Coryphaenoides rupestris]
ALTEEPSKGQRPLKRTHENKHESRSIRLNNNIITDLTGLHTVITHFLAEPLQLAWLDLSFNDITHIDPVLCELGELRVLYLHGNCISNLSEVDRLAKLPFLHTITLHGNVIEGDKDYRRRVIFALAKVKAVDFSAVTPQERRMANIWSHHNGCCKFKIKNRQ